MGVLGILLSLGLLMYLAYRGYSVLLVAPLLALLAALTGGETRLLAVLSQVYMRSLGGFVTSYFAMFMLGAILGRLMADSGSALAIARWIVGRLGARQAVFSIAVVCALLTYGGVSVFVVMFAAYPVAATLFRNAGTPKRLIPAAVALGAATFTLTALPGSPSIHNAMPIAFFGTDTFAAPGIGIIGGLVMFLFGGWWLRRRTAQAEAAGEGYGDHPIDALEAPPVGAEPPLLVALPPLVVVLVGNAAMTWWIIPAMDLGYLKEARFGSASPNDVRGLWALVTALGLANVTALVLHWSRWQDLRRSLNEGTLGSMLPVFNTASEIAYGTVIASLAGFAAVQAALGTLTANVLVNEAVTVNVMAGLTGSASGGLGLALGMMAETYSAAAAAAGISPELLHRVAAIACGGLDSLPHNGAVITILGICRLTHREAYYDLGMVSVVGPLCANVVVLVVASTFGSF
ncbi:MAG: GntP family permease [Vicinamibacterales bacterium]